jgi:hypothetical protein
MKINRKKFVNQLEDLEPNERIKLYMLVKNSDNLSDLEDKLIGKGYHSYDIVFILNLARETEDG